LHIVFNLKKDRLVFDVGHQCYTHKILTGRLNTIDTIRTKDGISGFPKIKESDYDSFNVGHSSTSISAALGLAQANILNDKESKAKTIAVIGDGALSGGLAYEGLNNVGRFKKNLIVILNDNKMSISGNVGSMARYLAQVRTKPGYLKTKENLEHLLNSTPLVGDSLLKAIKTSKSALRNVLYKSTLFEEMGFLYYGPVDGHDISRVIEALEVAKCATRPTLVHIVTKKGKGYEFAEKDSTAFHGVSKFDIETGEGIISKISFSDIFEDTICKLAVKDKRVCAVTAAMKSGTGLTKFSKEFRERYFDVGIAEEHAVTFSGAMAVGGMLPIFAVYSTFLQRSYDQLIHDVVLQGAKIVLAIDRAGVVGEDGETHQGVFDVSMLNSIPDVTIFSPSYFEEIEDCFNKSLYSCNGLSAVRYPRGGEFYKPDYYTYKGKPYDVVGDKDAKITIITYGRIFAFAAKVMEELLSRGIEINVIKLNKIKPIDKGAFEDAIKADKIFFFEEGMRFGGCGEMFINKLYEMGYKGDFLLTAIEDRFVTHATISDNLHELHLDTHGMKSIILNNIQFGAGYYKKRKIR
jgi:1-deoxy-D-xylulose-5-phosphate synthase